MERVRSLLPMAISTLVNGKMDRRKARAPSLLPMVINTKASGNVTRKRVEGRLPMAWEIGMWVIGKTAPGKEWEPIHLLDRKKMFPIQPRILLHPQRATVMWASGKRIIFMGRGLLPI